LDCDETTYWNLLVQESKIYHHYWLFFLTEDASLIVQTFIATRNSLVALLEALIARIYLDSRHQCFTITSFALLFQKEKYVKEKK